MFKEQVNRVLGLFFAGIVGILIMTSCVTDDDPEKSRSLTVGDSLPAFIVELNTGETVSDISLRGKTSMIVFFNTSCMDCREELPVIQSLYEIYKDDEDVAILAISRSQSVSSVQEYWNENNLTIPFSAQDDDKVYLKFASALIPRIYIADGVGYITAAYDDNPLPGLSQLQHSILSASR